MADQELARDLGFLEAYTMGVGTMIGAGIFVLPSIAVANAGPASMISFVIGGVVSLLAALSLSELATGMPKAGGSYYYVNTAMGGFFGSIVGWGMWSGLMFASAFYMLGFGQYLTYFSPQVPVIGSALLMAALLVWINYRGVKETGNLQNIIVILLLASIIVFIVFGIFEIQWDVLRPFNPKGWGAVAATAATVYVSFIGFEVIATSAEEIKNPGRNLPLSMIASVLTPMLLYVLVILVATGVLPVPELVASKIPVAETAAQYMGTIGALLMVVGALLATVSSANASILSAARVNFAMGRDKVLTNWLNQIHSTYRTPYRAILVTGGVILLLIGFGTGLETLADVASFTYLLTYTLVHVAVIVMRRAQPDEYEPDFKLPPGLYPTVPIIGALGCLVIMFRMRPVVLLAGGGLIGIGVLWYLFYSRGKVEKPSLIGEAIAPQAEELEEKELPDRIVVALANPATEKQLIHTGTMIGKQYENAELVAVNAIEVPSQTALDQELTFEEERIKMQQSLLQNAREAARQSDVRLRPRAILGRNAAKAILNVVQEEDAKHLVLGWSGKRGRGRFFLGSNLDTLAREAPCEVTLVKPGKDPTKDIVVLVGTGPNAGLAMQRGYQLTQLNPGSTLSFLNVQVPGEEGEKAAQEAGQQAITDMADNYEIPEGSYQSLVKVGKNVRQLLLQSIQDFDTVCVGATRSTKVTQAVFGSIPETIGASHPGTVLIIRNRQYKPRTIRQALLRKLTGGNNQFH